MMAAPTKQSSRWGSFLQQAVAGVESRLDNMLAEGDEAAKPVKPVTTTQSIVTAAKPEIGVSRNASTSSRTNDRLQERLARAVAAKNSSQQKSDFLNSSTVPSRTGSPLTNNESPRRSIDVVSESTEEKTGGQGPASLPGIDVANTPDSTHGVVPLVTIQPSSADLKPLESSQELNGAASKLDTESAPRPSTESARSSIPRESIDSIRQQASDTRSSAEVTLTELPDIGLPFFKSPAEDDALLKQLQSDLETLELQRQEEVHGYIERIDALQAKLQYLARDSAESAKAAGASAPAGSLEKKLADKEEQVALLMEEGQQLSKKELNHLNTIKKLRAKLHEDTKELTEAKKKQEKAEKDAAILSDRWKRAEGSEKRLSDMQKLVLQFQRGMEVLKADRDNKDHTIVELRTQLEEAITQENQAEIRAAHESLELERRRAADLEDDLANLKIEKSLVADRGQAQIKELREKMDKEAERARTVELEMKTEQHMLESKLEVMRTRAEEVSSGATGDAQAKLLRQIETLQTQYAVASENWQGIQSSLVARATSLEREKDEATRREADIRRKAREVTLKAKRTEDELEETRSKLPGIQKELDDHKERLNTLQRRAEEAEAALTEARAAFDKEKQTWRTEMQQQIDEEKLKWQEEASGQGSLGYNLAESPVASTRRGLTSEFLGLQNLQIRRASGRRPSTQPLGRSSGNGTPTRQDSIQSVPANGEIAHSPSIHTVDHDDFFENNASPSSPQQTINDMVSVSTAGAGPSVQLVERMSSAVRRLESEKVANKEDLARLSAQRDEARAEIFALMREVDAKRAADRRVSELEVEIKDIHSRYQTSLEMLGEKAELVDELRSDIEDIKAMYRELVERTVK